MAKRILYDLRRYEFQTYGTAVEAVQTPHAVAAVPAIFWADGSPWLEGNIYLAHRASAKCAEGRSIEAVQAESWHLRDYAEFLEIKSLNWRRFPLAEAERPTKQYRGYLVRARREQRLSPSTASMRIAAVTRFYEWALAYNQLEPGSVPFTRKTAKISREDKIGRSRTIEVSSTDLSIPNRNYHSEGVEDGLFPLDTAQRQALIALAQGSVHIEFRLMLLLGFFSGMRIGTITSLTRSALRQAFPSRDIAGWQSIEVGPRVGIPTKGAVKYFPSMPPWLLSQLRDYCRSVRALERQRAASPEDHDLVFLKRNSGHYTNTTCREEMAKLRRMAESTSLGLTRFKFHCTRATFGTSIVEAYLKHTTLTSDQILAKLISLMGHSTVQSSLRYLKFVKEASQDDKIMDDYFDYMFGQGVGYDV